MRLNGLLFLAAGASAITIKLPLNSLSADKDGHAARGVSKYQRRNATSSGVNVPVTDWFNRTDNQWYTTFSLGTPPQNFTALFDTGSPDFIIGASNCTTCGSKKLFDPSLSSTYVDTPGTFQSYLFATGANSIPWTEYEGATGYLVQDTLAWGDLKVENQTFVICDSFAEGLDVMPIDGIMGVGPDGFTIGGQSWFYNLVEAGQLDSAQYGFYLPAGSLHGGEVTLGGYDATKFQGDLHWTACDTAGTDDFGAYIVDQLAIYANGVELHNQSVSFPVGYAILDTGTAFMMTPDYATAETIYAQISPEITQIDPAGAWGAPCDVLDAVAPALTFTLDTVNVTMPAAAFNLGEYPGLEGICQAVFNNPSAGIGDSWFDGETAEWLVGSPLLKQYYTVWDGDALKVGWGQLPGGPGF